MNYRILLPILGTLVATCLALTFESEDILRGMVIDKRGHIYIGAVNALYQLDPLLNVLNYTVTGPVQDNPACAPPQLGMEFCLIEGEEMRTTDNYNQLILIDDVAGHLISCGSVFQGTCTARMLEDISFAIPDMESFYVENYVVATDHRLKSVGFIGEVEPGKQSLFIGGFVSADDEFTVQENKKAAIANRKLLNQEESGTSFTYYTSMQRTLFYQRSWHVKPYVDISYVSAFQDDRFAYFLFHERQLATGMGTETRIARTCLSDTGNTNSPLSDSTYTSYIEIPISCTYEGVEYPALSSVDLVESEELYQGDRKVLVGTFSNEKNNTQTAICTFSFDEINRRLNAKTLACANGEGVKKIRSEARDNVLPCTNSRTTCEDVCTCNIKNDNYPLEVSEKLRSSSTKLIDGYVRTIATNVVKGEVEVFLGVDHHHQHSLQKYVIESVDRVHHIDDYSPEPLSSKVLQIEVLSQKAEVLILTENSLFTRPISVCASYVDADCQKCIQVRDPHCGWCEMAGRCTPEHECTSDVWRTEGACTSITAIEPNMMSMGTQREGNKVTVTTNNQYPEGTPISCDFGKYGLREATVGEEGQIVCLIPVLRPPIDGQHMVDFSLISGDTVLASSERAFTFFNCESYTTCSTCTSAAVDCGWCTYDNRCDQICDNISEPHQCPALNYGISYIPADFSHRLEVSGRNLPQPFDSEKDNYTCVVNIGGEETRLEGTYVNSTKIVCATNHTFTSLMEIGEVVAPVQVLWKAKEVEAERQPQIDIYRCNVLGKDCSSCRANGALRRCGWCDELSQCLLTSGGYNVCPSSYSSVCVGLTVESFEPKHGPVEGGTLVTIRGTNLGSRPTDITSIKIAGLPCEVQSEGFEVSRAVVCETAASGVPKHGLVEVTTSGDQYIYPNFMYYYKKHKVNNVSPSCGIAAGGTDLTITGEELNIGVQMSVVVAGTLCDVTDKASQREVRCTTRAGVIGKTNLQVNIDGGMVNSPSMFEVVENPIPQSLSVNSSISSGGIPVEIEFKEEYRLECVQKLWMIFEAVNLVYAEESCEKSGSKFICKTPTLDMKTAALAHLPVSYVNAALKADNHLITLDPFPVHADPTIVPYNNTNPDGFIEWPLSGGQQFVINGHGLNKVAGLKVFVGEYSVTATTVTNDHVIFIPPTYKTLKKYREQNAHSRSKREDSSKLREESSKMREESRKMREASDDVTTAPDKRSHDKKYSSEYTAVVKVQLGNWKQTVGKLYYTKSPSGGIPYVAIIIPIAGFIVLVVLLSYVGLKYHRSQRSHRRTLKTVRMHMEKLEMRVANECKDAFTALQMQLTDVHGNIAEIPFRPFSDFMANVLFPGTEPDTKDLLARLSAPDSKVVETARIAQFRRLLRNKAFLQKFVEVVEADPHFDVANKCKMASLLVIVISNDMGYLTEVLFSLMEKLIDKFLAKKNHPQLLLRRTESVADKLLTHWLNYCCYQYLRQNAGKSIFTLFSAIKQQLDLGPQDEITFEAKLSLNNEKMLRETIEFKTISGTVRDLNKNEHPVTLLTCDSIKQAKRKVIESVHRGKPASQIPPIESFDLMYIRTGNTPIILRENQAPVVEGWRKLSTLADYKLEDAQPVLAMIPLSTDSEHSSLSPTTDRRKASFLTTKRYRSKGNLITAGMNTSESEKSEERHQVYHLVKPGNDINETDTLLSTKMMSEVFLTRLLSTKGTLQPYVDDLLCTVFMSRERVPPCVKYLFDFLERQAQRHNLLHNQACIHTWKNNSLSLRFWMNVIKNPQFLLDIDQTPTIDSSLNIVCGIFMDSCSTSDKGLTKDSPINKLLYAKDIPRYRKQVQKHYEQVSSLPPAPLDFLTGLPPTGLNSTVAVSELLSIANKYQKQLQASFGPDSPSLNLKFTSIIDASLLTAPNLV